MIESCYTSNIALLKQAMLKLVISGKYHTGNFVHVLVVRKSDFLIVQLKIRI